MELVNTPSVKELSVLLFRPVVVLFFSFKWGDTLLICCYQKWPSTRVSSCEVTTHTWWVYIICWQLQLLLLISELLVITISFSILQCLCRLCTIVLLYCFVANKWIWILLIDCNYLILVLTTPNFLIRWAFIVISFFCQRWSDN